MKRILPVLLAFLVLLTLPVHAADGRLTASAAESGDTVTITVHLDNPGIISTRIFVRYDADALQLTAADNGEIFPLSNTTFGRDLSNNPYIILWDQSTRRDNNTTSGTLCTLTFTVTGGTKSGKANVTIEADKSSTLDVDLNEVAVANGSCSVSVPVVDPEPTAGKVHSVTANDLSLVYRYDGVIKPVVTADSGVRYTVAYSGFDGKIISVNANGTVTAEKAGTTDVTVTVTDEFGNTAECSCNVTVRYAWWQILIRVFLLGFIWY